MKSDWRERISQPEYSMRVEKDIYVPMRDGVRLAVDVYRPDCEGKFPALMAASPYGKEIQQLPIPPQAQGGPLWEGCTEAGDMEYIVSRGYVHVVADLRGTGYSEGQHVGLLSKQEAMDGHDIVEWIARQPWCDGNVGLVGMSYYGAIQPWIAIEQPPHLKAIFPIGAWTDTYRHCMYHGGVICTFFYGLWDGRGGDAGYAMKNVASAMSQKLTEEEFKARLEEIASHPDIRAYSNFLHLMKYPYKNPLFADMLLNPCDGPFYYERSATYELKKINIPTCIVGAWLRSWWATGALDIYNNVSSDKKKIIIDPSGTFSRPWASYHEEVIRWFDHWLKGNDTGMMDEPPIKMYVKGINQWRYEDEWPLKSMRPEKYYLRNFGGLSPDVEIYGFEPDSFVQPPLYASYDINMLKYRTAPFSEDVEMTGPVALYLYASIDQDNTTWIVHLNDVDAQGKSELLALGYLNAVHKAVDPKKSTQLEPYHPFSKMEPVTPGEICEYAIQINPISNVFKAGHRLELEIRSREHANEPGGAQPPFAIHVGTSKTVLHKIYHNAKYPSHLVLPVIS